MFFLEMGVLSVFVPKCPKLNLAVSRFVERAESTATFGDRPMRFQRPRKSGDVLAIVVLMAFGLTLLLLAMFLPTQHGRFNWDLARNGTAAITAP
jgi:hypothetical protein